MAATGPAGCVVVIFNDGGQVLLQLRDDIAGICWPGHWSLPGGHRETGESWEQTARREVAEETGIVLEAVNRVDVDRHPSQQVPPVVFGAFWDGPEQDLVVGEGQALRFFGPGRLPSPIPPHIGHYIRQASVARTV